MDDQEMVRRITSLEARVDQMQALMERLLNILADNNDIGGQIQIRDMLQELRLSPDSHAGFILALLQKRPEMKPIRLALLSGNKIEAIKLYREIHGVGLKEAKKAIDAVWDIVKFQP